jgi:hypothetical protein
VWIRGDMPDNSLSLFDLVSFSSVVALAVAAAATTLTSERLMSGVPTSTTATERGPAGEHITIEVRGASAMPNLWIWYEGEAIYDVLQSHRAHLYEYLQVVVFHAALHTATVAFFLLFFSMWILKLTRGGAGSRKTTAAALAGLVAAAFVCDLLEDLGMIVILVGYPTVKYDWLATTVSWCSLGKFWWWLCTGLLDAALALRYAISGAEKAAQD